MRKLKRKSFVPLLLTAFLVLMMAMPVTSIASQATVELGSTADFAVLAGTTVTNTGTTTINGTAGGNVGVYPGSAFPGQANVTITNGTVHFSDAVAINAKTDLVTAYDDAAARTPVTTIPSELGGQTLTPGVYTSATGAFQITGTLTLDAQGDPDGVFVFQMATTLITAADSSVNLTNSARYCRTFWQVGSSATLGTNSYFEGHIFALTSITAKTGATIHGQLLARNGAVTLDSNIINNGICAALPSATLHVIKAVVNDDGRTAAVSDFNLHVMAAGIDVEGSPAAGAAAPGTTYTLDAGTYVVSEDPVTGYTHVFSGDSDGNGNVTLAAGANKTVTLTNNDTAVGVAATTGAVTAISTGGVTATMTGGTIPTTATPWYNLLLAGVVLFLIGTIGWSYKSRHEYNEKL